MSPDVSVSLPPIFIQSSKITSWLLGRKLVPADYPKKVDALRLKVNEALFKLDQHLQLLSSPSLFLSAIEILNKLKAIDTKTDFFGRASPPIRVWTDIVDLFKKNNLHLVEVGECLHELASLQVPKCRNLIADRQKCLTDLRQKLKEHHLNLVKKEELLKKSYEEFKISTDEKHIKLRILEEAAMVPRFLEEYVNSLKDLRPALDLYIVFTKFLSERFDSISNKSGQNKVDVCPTLKLLIESGNVIVFTWKNGYEPEKIETSDDHVLLFIQHEKQKLAQSELFSHQTLLKSNDPFKELEDETEIVWDTNENDQNVYKTSDADEHMIDFEIETEKSLSIDGSDLLIENKGLVRLNENSKSDANNKQTVASGELARHILDSSDGRKALLNDLCELSSFLNRFYDDLLERQGMESNDQTIMNRFASNSVINANLGGVETLKQIIIQNAPQSIQFSNVKEVGEMIKIVDTAYSSLRDNSLCQLMMIRTKPMYLDRLIERLNDFKRQVELSKTRLVQTQYKIDQAIKEQEIQAIELLRCKEFCKTLVSFLEEEISRICGRKIQIIGQVLDL